MGLSEYKRKRDFKVTAEPAGRQAGKKTKALRFVIQKHDATRLHYDFRLEMEGVLKSWAVPKGLPWAQAERHLAVEVEDHPFDYADFEGIIPAGQYGGGTVMVWDRGTYEVTHAESPLAGLRAGKFHVILHGEKIQGEWALIRIKNEGGKNQWLLMKTGGGMKPLSAKRDDQSVTSGRTMKQIASDRDAEWQSNRPGKKDSFKARIARAASNKGKKKRETIEPKGLGKLPKARAAFVEPMKPRLVEEPPTVGDWLYELKFDGIRALVIKNRGKIELLSRNQNNLNKRFPEMASACAAIAADEYLIDSEVVALDDEGRSSFQLLQNMENASERAPLLLYAFDLLQLGGRSLLGLPLVERREALREILPEENDVIRFSDELGGNPKLLLQEVERRGLEGIVGKQRRSLYEAGRRSGAWIKIKCVNEQEFVIGGFTPPAGARKYFGALLVGYREGGKFVFAGKVGTGFNEKSLATLHRILVKMKIDHSPFDDLSARTGSAGLTPGELRRCTWARPQLICQVKFSEWTHDGKLRQPVFLGLREDKKPAGIKREKAAAISKRKR